MFTINQIDAGYSLTFTHGELTALILSVYTLKGKFLAETSTLKQEMKYCEEGLEKDAAIEFIGEWINAASEANNELV